MNIINVRKQLPKVIIKMQKLYEKSHIVASLLLMTIITFLRVVNNFTNKKIILILRDLKLS
jgi:hypothetical protein